MTSSKRAKEIYLDAQKQEIQRNDQWDYIYKKFLKKLNLSKRLEGPRQIQEYRFIFIY